MMAVMIQFLSVIEMSRDFETRLPLSISVLRIGHRIHGMYPNSLYSLIILIDLRR
jgi:hypothetical protein